MTIVHECKKCGKRGKVKSADLGRSVKCPKCGNVQVVMPRVPPNAQSSSAKPVTAAEAEPAVPAIVCPKCKEKDEVSAEELAILKGKKTQCVHCGYVGQIPLGDTLSENRGQVVTMQNIPAQILSGFEVRGWVDVVVFGSLAVVLSFIAAVRKDYMDVGFGVIDVLVLGGLFWLYKRFTRNKFQTIQGWQPFNRRRDAE